jgi:predicted transcriptional regulator
MIKIKRKVEPKRNDTARLSVTLPGDQYTQLQDLAEKKRVSIAWVVRDAVEKYLIGDATVNEEER